MKAAGNLPTRKSPASRHRRTSSVLLNAWASEQAGASEPVGSGEPGLADDRGDSLARRAEGCGKSVHGRRDVARLFTVWPMKDPRGWSVSTASAR